MLVETKEMLEYHLSAFGGQNQKYIKATRYCTVQWLLGHKEKFVVSWANKVIHFSNYILLFGMVKFQQKNPTFLHNKIIQITSIIS